MDKTRSRSRSWSRSLTDKTRSQEQEVVYNDPNNWEIDTIVVAINLWWLGYFKKDPSFSPYMDVVPVPKDIVEAVRRKVTQDNTQHIFRINLPQKNHDMYSHLAMARTGWIAIEYERVKLADVEAWVVKESDGLNHCAVTLFPHMKCSCPSPMHLLSHNIMYRLMAGLHHWKLASCREDTRQRKETPAGRKQPHRNDFEPVKESKRMKCKLICHNWVECSLWFNAVDDDSTDDVKHEDGCHSEHKKYKCSESKSVKAEDSEVGRQSCHVTG